MGNWGIGTGELAQARREALRAYGKRGIGAGEARSPTGIWEEGNWRRRDARATGEARKKGRAGFGAGETPEKLGKKEEPDLAQARRPRYGNWELTS